MARSRFNVYALDAPREVRREQGRRSNTFSMVVPDHGFNIASDMWEPPDQDETQMHAVRCIATGRAWDIPADT